MKELTENQKQQLYRLKQYFPYRIIFGVLTPENEFLTFAETTKRKMNNYAKMSDHVVFKLG